MINTIFKVIGRIKFQYNLWRFRKIIIVVLRFLDEYEKSVDWPARLGIRNAKEEFFRKTKAAQTKEDMTAALAEFRSRLEEVLVSPDK